MRRDRISRLADRRRLYTNETYDQARSQLNPGQPPIPAPPGEQRNFEAELFYRLLYSHHFTQYPFGIRRVRPGTDSITLEVESEQRAEEILNRILPAQEPDGEVHGIPAVRVRRRTQNGIEVHQCGRRTSAWLTGLPAYVWKRVEAACLDTLADIAWRPLWKGPAEWTDEEALSEQHWNTGEWMRHFQDGAWSGSGLLRRLAVLHTVVPADAVTGYKGLPIRGYDGMGPVRWCLDLCHRTGIRYRKEELVDALTDAEFGLPVAIARHLDRIYPQHTMENWVRLDDQARTGLIELRFCTFNYPELRVGTAGAKDRAIAEGIQARVDIALASD
ncbi:hypothetical protein AB0E27_38550 [Streptomyces sparsogenes]|uniref:hypothetical protein n=1 Tax=Streptomyces sparsogenes TaxID=67365 RepID=UPI0034019C50